MQRPANMRRNSIIETDKLDRQIAKSMKYGDLDYKWAIRNYIKDFVGDSPKLEAYKALARSSFEYYNQYKDVLLEDKSLAAVLTLCTDEQLQYDTNIHDPVLFYLSNTFNRIVLSERKMHKCYDCGTNARAMFLKLIQVHRGVPYISQAEQQRMGTDYRVSYEHCVEKIERCWNQLQSFDQDCVFIMSIGVDEFGHVWVIEKRFFDIINEQGVTMRVPRYHHYQSSFRSHLVLDFIEREDYGRDLNQSLDIAVFFSDLRDLMSIKRPWTEKEYVLFCKMFAFHPVSDVLKPNPGFCYTYAIY